MLLQGNCLETLKTLPDNSVDSVVTDPPYELGFMGKSWDNSGIAYNVAVWQECLRVLKPGGHLLAFGGSRTYHRLACAVEDAGFEVRDQIMWIYGSGFPKSYNVAKGIEGTLVNGSASWNDFHKLNGTLTEASSQGANGLVKANSDHGNRPTQYASHGSLDLEPTTEEAKKWQGWGTALKPAHEPICVARKPLVGTVANNVLTYGTGALNIDGSRVGYADGEVNFDRVQRQQHSEGAVEGAFGASALIGKEILTYKAEGRWPANVIHDGSEEVLAGFPNGHKSGNKPESLARATPKENQGTATPFSSGQLISYNDETTSAARFFYCAKASKAERNAGLDGQNFHPTVKPLALMRYLVRLVCPPNGVVLDPFLGSGTTAVAAVLEGFDWVGCELTEEYWSIIEKRINWAQSEVLNQTPTQESLF
jgi:DNA methylase